MEELFCDECGKFIGMISGGAEAYVMCIDCYDYECLEDYYEELDAD